MRKIEIAFSHKVLGLHVGKTAKFLFLTFEESGDAKAPMNPAVLRA